MAKVSRVILHPAARAEYVHEREWYEARSPQVSARFARRVREAINRVKEDPYLRPVWKHGMRRCLLEKYPFDLVYTVEGETVYVLAIASQKKRPGYWRRRVSWASSKT